MTLWSPVAPISFDSVSTVSVWLSRLFSLDLLCQPFLIATQWHYALEQHGSVALSCFIFCGLALDYVGFTSEDRVSVCRAQAVFSDATALPAEASASSLRTCVTVMAAGPDTVPTRLARCLPRPTYGTQIWQTLPICLHCTPGSCRGIWVPGHDTV